jgi:hypothetical protein
MTQTPGQKALRRVRRATNRALEEIAADLLERARRDVSIDDGDLRVSGRVTRVSRRAGWLIIEVRFGGGPVKHAAAQEFGHMSYVREGQRGQAPGGRIYWAVHHHPGGGRTHYLGGNVKAMVPEYRERIAKAVREALSA